MKTAHALARSLAEAIAASATVAGVVTDLFPGRSLRVFLDGLGSRDWETVENFDLFPCLVVSPSSEERDRADRTVAIPAVLSIRVDGDVTKPVQTSAGVYELPGCDALDRLADSIRGCASTAEIGSVYSSCDIDWDYGSEWPVQSALLTFHFGDTAAY